MAIKVAILGARGMLGSDLVEVLEDDYDVIPCSRSECDVKSGPEVVQKMRKHRPAWVLNCAAYTDVDGAEKNQDEAYRVNRDGAATVAIGCRGSGARLIHFSTDYVFDGEKHSPYTEDDPPSPLGAYGRSKAEGEQEVLRVHEKAYIVRTSWTYGDGRSNFVEKMLSLASWKKEMRVVYDQVGSPTYTWDVARKVKEIMEAEPPFGIYHVTNSGICTRAEQAQKILEIAGIAGVTIDPVGSREFKTAAPRPKNSVLENARLKAAGIPPLRPWEAALKEYIEGRE